MSDEFTLDSVLYAPKNVVTKGTGEAYLLLDPDTPNWIVVNAVGKDILTLCDGTRTVKETTKTLCEKHHEPYEGSIDSVLTFVNGAKKNRFLREDPFPPSSRVDKENAPLVDLWINVTNKCNLRCIHCHLSSGTALENEMTKKEIIRVIDEARDLGVRNLTISGGEPLVRNDILSIVEYAHEQNIDRITVVTNGTLITNETAEKFSKLNVDVQVSLDGAREETHDFIRGKGTYKKTIGGIKKLVNAGAHFYIGMTIMKKNMNEMQEMAELSKSLRINVLHLTILQNKGRAKENPLVIGLEDEDYVTAIKKMKEISNLTNINISTEEAFRGKVERLSKIDLCGAGSGIISVAADGNVYPCAGLHEKEFCAGNIRDQSLRDIWKTSAVFKRFRSLSILDIEDCRNCELKFICGGGCHANKYNAYGHLDTPSVQCKACKEIFWDLLFEKIKEIENNL